MEVAEENLFLGGEAANTANALSSWKHPIALAGNGLGSGPDAERLWELIKSKGLPTDGLNGLPASSGGQNGGEPAGVAPAGVAPVCDIYVTPDGERTMFGLGFAKANPGLAADRLPLKECRWFTAEPNMGERAREMVRTASDAGANVYLMDFIRDTDPIYPGSFWQASTDLAGHRNNMQRNVQWVKEWVARWGCNTILSDGPNGFVFGGPNDRVRAYPPFPAPSVIDTTGAGDVFRAGMLYGLDSDWSLPDTLRFASAAGCLKCRALGATTDIASVEEILRHVSQNPDVSSAYG